MRSSFTGFTDIFKFAFVQTVKSRVFVIMQIILCAVALLAFPVITMLSGDENDEQQVGTSSAEYIGTIYIQDSFMDGKLAEGLEAELKASEEYGDSDIRIVNDDGSSGEIMKLVEKSKNGDVYICIDYTDDVNNVNYGFNYSVYYGEETEELEDAADGLASYVDNLHEKVLTALLVDNEAISSYIASDFSYEVCLMGADNEVVEAEGVLEMGEYWATYAFLMIAIFTISIAGSKVAEQLVTEKSTKVIEYIMTSVKPMALITGKVLASVASIVYVVGSAIVCLLLSGILNGVLFPNEDGSIAIPDIIVTFFSSDVMAGATTLNIIVAVLILILGIIFYGFIGGIAGATVSKVEEMAEGVKMFTFVMVIGAYLPMFMMVMSSSGGGDWGIVTDIIYVLPITSVFIVPAYILIGKVSLTVGLISLAVMVIAVLLMLVIVSRIFEYLIYYNGSPLKLKDLIKIYKDKRRAK